MSIFSTSHTFICSWTSTVEVVSCQKKLDVGGLSCPPTQGKAEQSSLSFQDQQLICFWLQKISLSSVHCNDTIRGVRCRDETCERVCDRQEINQINTSHLTASWSELLVRLIHKNGQNWPIVWWFDRFGGSTQYLSVNGCFSWLPHLVEVVLRLDGGGNSPSFALFPLWEPDHLSLASQQTLFSFMILTLGMMIQRKVHWNRLMIKVLMILPLLRSHRVELVRKHVPKREPV